MTAPLDGYSTREVARMLGLPGHRIRAFVRAGFLEPRRHGRAYRFSFQDLVILRAAQGLVDADVPAERVQRALARLKRDLPEDRPLGSVRIAAHGHRVVVREEDAAWEPESGQLLFDFTVSELERKTDLLAHRTVESTPEPDRQMEAEDWYATGWDLEEEDDPEEAERAYRHALDLDPDHADAHLNLGRLLHDRGRLDLAELHYRKALETRPGDAVAAFNLGVALQDQERPREAVEAYQTAVRHDPHLAEAYFNLAGLYETLGEQAVAIQNWKKYRSLISS